MESLAASVHQANDPDQSAQLLHPKLFPRAQARAYTQNPFVCVVRAWISPRLIQRSVAAARPNLGKREAAFTRSLHAT